MAPKVEILLPTISDQPLQRNVLAPRLTTLQGKRIGLISNRWRSIEIMDDVFQVELAEQYGVARCVKKFATTTGPIVQEDFEELKKNVDAVITGLGN